ERVPKRGFRAVPKQNRQDASGEGFIADDCVFKAPLLGVVAAEDWRHRGPDRAQNFDPKGSFRRVRVVTRAVVAPEPYALGRAEIAERRAPESRCAID